MKVNITVKDINDNKPELAVDEIFLCENDIAGTVIKTQYLQYRLSLDFDSFDTLCQPCHLRLVVTS